MNLLDRFFTWSADTLLPKWCQSPEHWTAKVSAYLFTDCPCCLVFRGIVVGAVLAAPVGAVIGFLFGKL